MKGLSVTCVWCEKPLLDVAKQCDKAPWREHVAKLALALTEAAAAFDAIALGVRSFLDSTPEIQAARPGMLEFADLCAGYAARARAPASEWNQQLAKARAHQIKETVKCP